MGDAPTAPNQARPPLRLVATGLSLKAASLDELERHLADRSDLSLDEWFRANEAVSEFVALRTCQRLELYAIVSADAADGLTSVIEHPFATNWSGYPAVEHLFHVAGGLESVAVGEPEVRGQLRRASSRVRSRHPRGILRALIRQACDAADQLPRPQPSQSVAALAATKLLEEVGSPFPRVVVVGSGTVGLRVVERLAPFARLTLTYRSAPPTDAFLRETGARAVPVDALSEELRVSDAVITAAKTGGRLFGPELVGPRTRPLLIVDLGVPRNVDSTVRRLPGVRLLDLSELARPEQSLQAYQLIRPRLNARAARAWDELQPELWEPSIAAWWGAVDRLRKEECDAARPFLGPLSPAQRTAVERLTLRIVRRMMEPTTAKLRELRGGTEDVELRQRILGFLAPARPGS